MKTESTTWQNLPRIRRQKVLRTLSISDRFYDDRQRRDRGRVLVTSRVLWGTLPFQIRQRLSEAFDRGRFSKNAQRRSKKLETETLKAWIPCP